jgi:hypothetical protein
MKRLYVPGQWIKLSAYTGVKVYRKFYTEEKENSYGVLAISVSKPRSQPYITMTELLAVSGIVPHSL